jgi:membrane protease YdiL (CAAX protease family)
MIREKPWQLESVLRLAMGLFVSLCAGAFLVQGVQQICGQDSQLTDKLAFVVGSLSFHGAALVLVHFLLREHHMSWRELVDWTGLARKRLWLYAGLAFIISLPVVFMVNQASILLLESVGITPQLQVSVEILRQTQSVPQLAYFGLVAIVVAPVVEEILFRGVLYPVIKQQGYPQLALWMTSLLFAATHANLMAFLPLTVFAMILVALYERTDDLLAPMLTHGLFNLANFAYVVWEGAVGG